MRSFVSPRSRPLGRICDACQQRRSFTSPTTTTRLAAPISALSPCRPHTTTRPHAESARSNFTTTRVARAPSSSAAAAAAGQQQTDAAPEQQQQQQTSPATLTHYELFDRTLPRGPPPRGPFEVDVEALRREFLGMQAKAHPDMHPAGSAKRRAEAASARINEAFRTLAEPLARAEYLLALRGRDVANDETGTVDDLALLQEVLEARELIEDAADEADLAPLRAETADRARACERALAAAFAADDLDAAAREVVKLRYWVNIRKSIDNWEKGKPVVLEH